MSNKSLTSILFLTSVVCSGGVYAADHRAPVELTVVPSATVADLMASTVKGRSGFHFPDTPHFRHFYDISSPRTYNAFYELNAGRITLGSFVRFIEQGHTLFPDAASRRAYKKTLNAAVRARKNYAARTTKTNLSRLHDTETRVWLKLKKLPLADPTIHARLEEILSTQPTRSLVSRIGSFVTSWFILPFRANVKVEHTSNPAPTDVAIIKRPSLLGSVLGQVMFAGLPIFAGAALLSLPFGHLALLENYLPYLLPFAGYANPNFASWATVRGALVTTNILASAFSPAKLAPEPGNGVKVGITLSYTKSALGGTSLFAINEGPTYVVVP